MKKILLSAVLLLMLVTTASCSELAGKISVFNFDDYQDYDLYHLRYGRGAVIVAVEKTDYEEAKARFEIHQQLLKEAADTEIKPLREEMRRLEEQLRELGYDSYQPSLLESLRRQIEEPDSRRSRTSSNPKREAEQQQRRIQAFRILTQIEILKEKINKLHYRQKIYLTNLQLSMLYTHNIPKDSEIYTRFDKILEIEEIDGYLKIKLEFIENVRNDHKYHSHEINKVSRIFDSKQKGGLASSVVTRIIPVDDVTFEIISNPDYQE